MPVLIVTILQKDNHGGQDNPEERLLKKPRLRPPQTANAFFLTLSSRRRSNATEKGLLKKPGFVISRINPTGQEDP